MRVDYVRPYHHLRYPLGGLAASAGGYYLRWWRYGPETERLVEEALERESWSAGAMEGSAGGALSVRPPLGGREGAVLAGAAAEAAAGGRLGLLECPQELASAEEGALAR